MCEWCFHLHTFCVAFFFNFYVSSIPCSPPCFLCIHCSAQWGYHVGRGMCNLGLVCDWTIDAMNNEWSHKFIEFMVVFFYQMSVTCIYFGSFGFPGLVLWQQTQDVCRCSPCTSLSRTPIQCCLRAHWSRNSQATIFLSSRPAIFICCATCPHAQWTVRTNQSVCSSKIKMNSDSFHWVLP